MSATTTAPAPESRSFEADVAKLLHLMVHSIYSEKEIFLRELISNAADACEKLRYEAISRPELLGPDHKATIRIILDKEARTLKVADNGIGMTHDELIDSLGTIARSGTRAFVDRLAEGKDADGGQLIGQFGVGFYSTFMVADKVDVVSRRAGVDEAWRWSSDGKGSYTIEPAALDEAPEHGTVVTVHLAQEEAKYAERFTIEPLIREHSGHVPVPIVLVDGEDEKSEQVTDGAALWTRPKSEITTEQYTDFYRGISGQFGDPALTVHVRAEGRHEYTLLAFVPDSRPFDLFDSDRKSQLKLYVRRVLISDKADILPGYLRFVRGIVDSADLPLNISREMIQESPLFASIRKAVTSRILSELEKLADSDAEAYAKIWDNFGAVIKEGLYEDFERRDTLLNLARFKTTTSEGAQRSLKDYVAALKENQTAIYYLTGDDLARLESSPQLEGFRARGIEVLLLTDPVDNFWVTTATGFDGKPFKSITQGSADLAAIPLAETKDDAEPELGSRVAAFIAFAKSSLGDEVSDVRASDRLTQSAVCLVASDTAPDRRLEQLLAQAGRLDTLAKPVLEINPRHPLIEKLAEAREAGDNLPLVECATKLLLDEARIVDGTPIPDPRGFSRRIADVLGRSLGTGT